MTYFAISFEHIKNRAISFVEALHQRVFGHAMSDEMRRFLGNLSLFFSAGLFSAAIMFGVNIVAGRFLGPLEFGKYNYILSWATTFSLFFLLGSNQSSVRYLSDKAYEDRWPNIVGSIILIMIAQVGVVFFLIFFLKNIISMQLHVDIATIYIVFSFGLTLALKELFDSFIRSFGHFRFQGLVRIGDALIVSTAFFLFWKWRIFGVFAAPYYVYAMISGAAFTTVCFSFMVRRNVGRPTWKDAITIFHYNKFLILGMIAGVIMSLEKVFIGNYIGLEALGVYSAYYTSSQMILSNLSLLFMNIFWPTIIKNKENLEPVVHKLTTVFFRYFPIWFVLNCIVVSLLLLLFGKQYPLYFSHIILFSAVSLLNVFFSVYIGIMNIDKIARSVTINTILFGAMIASIIVFKSISVYLISQLFLYSMGIMYVRNNLLADLQMKKL